MRWTDRLIGIASTLILARILVPADFGIVAMASLVVALIDTLLDLGVNTALVQNREANRDDFDTAWTLRLLQSTLAAVLIALFGAPLAAEYFNDPRVVDVLRIMAITVLFSGFENIGIVAFQKNMEFGRDFRFFFLRRVAGFLVTIALALWLRSYWAMVFGALAGRLVGVGLSYALHEFRPRFSLAKFSRLWSFSQWILVRNLGNYGAQQTDKLVVGRRSDAGTLGAYSLADEISAMPTGEVLMPLGRVLFPAFVRVADKPEELRRAFCLALGVQALIALPAGIGLALVAPIAVPLLLGPQWLAAIPLVQVLALMNVALALSHSSGYLLLALGRVRLQAVLAWVQFALLISLTVLVFPTSGAAGIAGIRLAVSAVATILLFVLVLQAVPILKLQDLFAHTWRPIIASCVMAGLLMLITLPANWPTAVQLMSEIALGGAAYVLTTLLLWRVSGYSEGAERYLLDTLRLKQRMAHWLGRS
jgi:O-antigen/teichoic acid export membrane protein